MAYFELVPAKLKLNDKMVEQAVKLGNFKTKQHALNAALEEFVQRQRRLRILKLAGKIEFDPAWDYKKMRAEYLPIDLRTTAGRRQPGQ